MRAAKTGPTGHPTEEQLSVAVGLGKAARVQQRGEEECPFYSTAMREAWLRGFRGEEAV